MSGVEVGPEVVVSVAPLVEALVQAETDADWDRWRTLVAEDVIIDHPIKGPQVGIEANLAVLRAFREAVDDYRRDVFDLVCDGNSGAYRFAITGVHARDLDGTFKATGRPFEVAGAAFFTAWDGRMVRLVELFTTNTFLPAGA